MRRALAINEKNFGPEHPEVARDLHNLGWLLAKTDRLAEAEQLYQRALTIWGKTLGKEHPEVTNLLENLAELLRKMNRLTEAEQFSRRCRPALKS